MSDSNQHINPLTGTTETTTGHPYDRDEFLREVVEELRDANERWPGLWTRLESLLNERDGLVEQYEVAISQRDEYEGYALRNHNDYLEEVERRERIEEQIQSDARKVEAYDRARSRVKIEGNTRAEYVLRIEALEEQLEASRVDQEVLREGFVQRGTRISELEEQFDALNEATRNFIFKVDLYCGPLHAEVEEAYDDLDAVLRAQEGSNPASSPLCECGHSRQNHRGADMSVGRSPCEATVYTEAPLGGGNAFTCHCRDYVPARSPDV